MNGTAVIDEPRNQTDPSDGPLSSQHRQELSQANRRAKKVLGAAKVATFNGWSFGVFAAMSLVFGMFSITSLLVGVGLGVVAWNEFRGRDLLRGFDPRGPHLLGWNQVGLIGLLVVYSLWCIFIGLTGPNPYQAYIDQSPELDSMLGPIVGLHVILTLGVYGTVIVVSVIFQGLNALYYFKRGKLLETYLRQTPPWIIELQRHTHSD